MRKDSKTNIFLRTFISTNKHLNIKLSDLQFTIIQIKQLSV